jgi:hypothetical protein
MSSDEKVISDQLTILNIEKLRQDSNHGEMFPRYFSQYQITLGYNNSVLALAVTYDITDVRYEDNNQELEIYIESVENGKSTITCHRTPYIFKTSHHPNITISMPALNQNNDLDRWIAHNACQIGNFIVGNYYTNLLWTIPTFDETTNKGTLIQSILSVSVRQDKRIVFVFTIAYEVSEDIKNFQEIFKQIPLLVIFKVNIINGKYSASTFKILGKEVSQYHVHVQGADLGTKFSVRGSVEEPWRTINVVPCWKTGKDGSETIDYRIWREYGTALWNVPITGVPGASAYRVSIDTTNDRNDIHVMIDDTLITTIREDCLRGYHLRWLDIDTARGEILLYKECDLQNSNRGVLNVIALGEEQKDAAYLVKSVCRPPPWGKDHCSFLIAGKVFLLRNCPAWLHKYSETYKYDNTHVRLFVKMNRIGKDIIFKAFKFAFFCEVPNREISSFLSKIIERLGSIIYRAILIPLSPNLVADVESALDYNQLIEELSTMEKGEININYFEPKYPFLNMRHLLSLYTEKLKDKLVSQNLDRECFAHLPSNFLSFPQGDTWIDPVAEGNDENLTDDIDTIFSKTLEYPTSLVELAQLDLYAGTLAAQAEKYSIRHEGINLKEFLSHNLFEKLFSENSIYASLKQAVLGFYLQLMDLDPKKKFISEQDVTDQNALVKKVMIELFKIREDNIPKGFIPIIMMDYFSKITGIPMSTFQQSLWFKRAEYSTEFSIARSLNSSNRKEQSTNLPRNMLDWLNKLRKNFSLKHIQLEDIHTILHQDYNNFFLKYNLDQIQGFSEFFEPQYNLSDYILCILLFERLKKTDPGQSRILLHLNMGVDEIPCNISELVKLLIGTNDWINSMETNYHIHTFWTENFESEQKLRKTARFGAELRLNISYDIFNITNWLKDFKDRYFDLFAGKIYTLIEKTGWNGSISGDLPNVLTPEQISKYKKDDKLSELFRSGEYGIKMYNQMFLVASIFLKQKFEITPAQASLDYFRFFDPYIDSFLLTKTYIVLNNEFIDYHNFLKKEFQDTNIAHERLFFKILLHTIEKRGKRTINYTIGEINDLNSIVDLVRILPAWKLNINQNTNYNEVGDAIDQSYVVMKYYLQKFQYYTLNPFHGDVINLDFKKWDTFFLWKRNNDEKEARFKTKQPAKK